MNKKRRQEIESIISELGDLRDRLEAVKDEEQEAFDNLGDNLQQSERGQQMEQNADGLDSCWSDLDSVIDNLQEVLDDC